MLKSRIEGRVIGVREDWRRRRRAVLVVVDVERERERVVSSDEVRWWG